MNSIKIDMSKSAEEKRQLIRNLIINIIDERKKVTKYARLLVLMRKKIKINNNILPIINIVKFYTKFLDASNSTDTERIYCFYHNIQKELFCENCQKVKVKFQSFVRGYCRHCSYACSTMDPKVRNKSKQTTLKRYGVEHPLQSEEMRKRITQTNLKKYGVEHILQSKEIREKSRQTNLERYGVEYPLQSEKIQEKIRQTNLERYGVEHTFQLEKFKEKSKQTSLERHGFEYASQSEEVKNKAKQTNLERHGFEYASQSEEVKNKVKQTNLERYGVEHPLQSEEMRKRIIQTNLKKYGVENPFQFEKFKEKLKKTNLERYGVEHPLQSEEIKNKFKQTNLERYGVENAFQSEKIKNKFKQTNLERYGVENPLQFEEIKNKVNQTQYQTFYNLILKKEYIRDYKPLFTIDEYKGVKGIYYKFKHRKCGHIFQCRIDNGRFPKCPKCYPSIISNGERELASFVNQYTDNIILNSRNIIPPKELDIYLPDYKLAIEYNGLYWHSVDCGKDQYYHIDKTISCWKNNIKLIQISENEWAVKQDAIKSLILQNIDQLPYYINAKDCVLKEVNNQEALDFLEIHNIYMPEDYDLRLGLYYDTYLVSYMGLTEGSEYYTINNYCNYNFTKVNSLPVFLNYLKDKTLRIYSNLRFDRGKLFKDNGFKKIEYINPQSICINEDTDNYIFDCGYICYQYN